jgi:hypothetical protein
VLFQGGYIHIFATFYYLTALLHRILFFYNATLWWCLSGSGSAEAMLVTTQAMKEYYNPKKDLNPHPYISNDILVLTMRRGNKQLLALTNTCIDCHSNGKDVYLGMLCFLQSFIHMQNGTQSLYFIEIICIQMSQ